MPTELPSRKIWSLAILFLLVSFLNAEALQMALGRFGAAKAKKGASSPEVGEAPKPQLLNADTNPTLRYPVSVDESFSISCGWLEVTRTGVTYSVVESGKKAKPLKQMKFVAPAEAQYLTAPEDAAGSEGFDLNFSDIKDIQLQKIFLLLYTSKEKLLLIYLSPDLWGEVAGNRRAFMELAQGNLAGTMAVQRGMQNFDSVLAEVKPPPSVTAPEVTLHAEPMTVTKGHAVTLVWTSSNATSLDLEPGIGKVANAGGTSLVPDESTTYTLTAAGPGGTKVVSVQVAVSQPGFASRPTLVLVEPSAAGTGQTLEVGSSPLTIRGVVMDASGIPAITINGRSVTIRPTSAQAAEFYSDPMVLHPGENRFEVSASDINHAETKVVFVARFIPAPPKAEPKASKGLAKDEILDLLRGDVPSARVADLVTERGIKFVPSENDLNEIRTAGGRDDLILALKQAPSPVRN